MLFASVGGYMSKNTEATICFINFRTNLPIVPMAAKWFDRSYGRYMIESSDFDNT